MQTVATYSAALDILVTALYKTVDLATVHKIVNEMYKKEDVAMCAATDIAYEAIEQNEYMHETYTEDQWCAAAQESHK